MTDRLAKEYLKSLRFAETIRKFESCNHEWKSLSPRGALYVWEKCRHCKVTRVRKVESDNQ